MSLTAVVFDVDGTLVDSEQEGHRVAFNLAFEEEGLPYRWDRDTYRVLLGVPGGIPRLRHYLLGQGVAPTESEALARRLHALKNAHLDSLISDLRRTGVRLAVATTGSARWVGPLLGALAPGPFEVMVTGSDVKALKPDPVCYRLALARLGLGPAEVIAVEDSPSGCAAAVGAGLACVVVTNSDTAGATFPGASLVVSGFCGHAQDSVVSDPLGVAPGLPLRTSDLAAVLAAASRAAAPARASVS